jgi:hypothetical protein
MSDLTRRFRSLGVAFVVLALSAGAVFATSVGLPAGAPSFQNTADEASPSDEASEAPESEAPESEAPESEAPDGGVQTQDAAPSDNHGALVSEAAQMDTPDGFANHGAFVSCVAHMKGVSATGFDWTTVTPDSCSAAPTDTSATDSSTGVNPKADAGKAKGAAGKAKGQAKHAAAVAGH